MSKINDLIKELCPNGVKFYPIKEIAKVSIGEFVHKNKQSENGKYPVYNGGTFNTGFYDEYNNAGHNVIVSARGANAGFINRVVGKYWAGNSCYTININDENILDWNYLYQYLKNNQKILLGVQQTGSIPAISKKQVEEFKVAVPPIEVQEEIVKILDRFVKLETELEAELEERNRQYEFWRGYLLDNKKDTYVKLGDLCRVITKGTTPKKYTDVGINFIKTEAFTGNYVDKNKLSFVDNDTHSVFLKRSILEENDILFTIAGATIGKMIIVTKELLPANTNQALAIIRLKDGVNLNYIKNILKSNYMKEYIKLCVKGSAQPNLNLQQLNNFKFPYPSLEEQENIVNVLNNFDRLINDINEGLPAEIELRKQQYKYYRNKLLSFKEI